MTEAARPPPIHQRSGGAERDRTADPLLAKQVLSQLSYSPNRVAPIRRRRVAQNKGVVGPGRFELPTSPLSGVRSNQLSYGPDFVQTRQPAHRPTKAISHKRLTIGAKLRKAKGRPSPCEASNPPNWRRRSPTGKQPRGLTMSFQERETKAAVLAISWLGLARLSFSLALKGQPNLARRISAMVT
jgi:hypothetical protein